MAEGDMVVLVGAEVEREREFVRLWRRVWLVVAVWIFVFFRGGEALEWERERKYTLYRMELYTYSGGMARCMEKG